MDEIVIRSWLPRVARGDDVLAESAESLRRPQWNRRHLFQQQALSLRVMLLGFLPALRLPRLLQQLIVFRAVKPDSFSEE